jgi:S-formylglutathione hydrolase
LRAVIKIAPHAQTETSTVKVVSSVKYCGGVLKTVKHWSKVNNCEMTFNIYLPDDSIKEQRCEPYPVLYFLSGLTANHENFAIKSHFGIFAQQHKIACVFPDTSPRETGIDGIKDDWTFGESAGYYVNATTDKYKKNFNMYSYINEELPQVINTHFHVDASRQSITGFSMGGMGALVSFLKNSDKYRSVSAFAPISHPTVAAWGKNAFEKYLGSVEAGKAYDPTELISSAKVASTILIDQGSADAFLPENLLVEDFLSAAHKAGVKVDYRHREGYAHNFWYVASFIQEHFEFHARYLKI